MDREYKDINTAFFTMLAIFLTISFLADPAFAVTIQKLQEPIKNLKTEIFSGWMMAVKICAAAAGIILAVFKGSLAPLWLGGGISIGTIFLDSYLGTGADGALI